MKQYRNDRNPKEPLFEFGRCLVHFAVDPDDVQMATRLEGGDTIFLPFNRGFDFGKGNPPNPDGHKTAYLWREILTRKSLANIVEHFAKLTVDIDRKTGREKRVMVFPRYHQLDVVRRLLADARQNGVGKTYLIQHSAGSGKSNSLTWLAYQLVELYDLAGERNVFDSVVIVTDRRLLDKQIKDNLLLFSEVKNILAHCESAQELKSHLEAGKKIIITTIQKFPVIVKGIEDLSERKFALIIDEAHSSQSGKASDTVNTSLGGKDDEEEEPENWQDKILRAMEGRKMGKNTSYFAFTATPKPATLEKFGQQRPDGTFHPFHLYSMKQAIEERFILDVLANYTTYRSYYEIQKSIMDNPLFTTAKAQKRLKIFVEAAPETIEVKARIMVDHFIEHVWQARKLKGSAKAMVATRNIECAIRYFFTVREALKQANMPFKAIVAFSGEKEVDGIKHTEASLNGFPSGDIADEFEGEEYKILVVANKFLTGFDQPLLHTLYVDKKLQGVVAVQAFSRLNRCAWKQGKQDTFVLDFYNTADDIKAAFDPFYTSTALSEPTDVNVLHDLRDALAGFGIYEWSEVEKFNERFFNNADAEELHAIVDAVATRFDTELEEKPKIDFKIKAKHFVKIYAQVACFISFKNMQWEMLYWFLKLLIPGLKIKDPDKDKLDELLDSIDLGSYGLERSRLNERIELDPAPGVHEPQNPNMRGYHDGGEQKDPLDKIIEAFNATHFAGWAATPEEQRVKFLNIARHVVSQPNYKAQVLDNTDTQNRELALEDLIKNAVLMERRRELDLYKHYKADPDFKRAFDASISRILAANPVELGLGASAG
jgi:type I restriction enzyme R subunit